MTDWRHRAACRDEDPELFFPVGNSGPALVQIAEAKTVCNRCPVAAQCLAWALDSGQEYGVWGGVSEVELRALRRRDAEPIPEATVDDADIRLALSGRAVAFTAAERRVAARRMLAMGHSRSRISQALKVNYKTVCSYLKEVQQCPQGTTSPTT